jgi:hypothetical protein
MCRSWPYGRVRLLFGSRPVPAQVHHFGRSQAMPVGQKHHQGVGRRADSRINVAYGPKIAAEAIEYDTYLCRREYLGLEAGHS